MLCVSKDPPETCAHFLTFHKVVGVKCKKLIFEPILGNFGQFSNLKKKVDVFVVGL